MDENWPLQGACWFIVTGGNLNTERTHIPSDPVLFSGGKWNCMKNEQNWPFSRPP
jgi:hypothetical protein